MPIATELGLDLDALMTEADAAVFACVSPRTLQAWRVKGGGPKYVKLGRAVRYRRRELQAWADENLTRTTSDAK